MSKNLKVQGFVVLFLVVLSIGFAFGRTTSEAPAVEGEPYHFTYVTICWDLAYGRIPYEEQPANEFFQIVEKKLGTAPLTMPWDWDGSHGHREGLRLSLAAGDKYDAICPVDEGIAQSLIDSGTAIPIGKLMEEHAPILRSAYNDEQWEAINKKDGGELVVYPQPAEMTNIRVGFIRQDWLDRVGMDVPTTKDEFVAVLRAFRDQDANGNGDPNDEIPQSGRELLRWFDNLFMMFGVKSFEGHVMWEWNEEKGILESHQVSDGMRQAIEFIRELYAEGLMDPVMPVQPGADWGAKINGGKVGTWFHQVQSMRGQTTETCQFMADEPELDVKDFWTFMPAPPRVPGIPEQGYTMPKIGVPYFCITKWAENPELIMKWANWCATEEGVMIQRFGLEGKHWEYDSAGNIKVLADPPVGWRWAMNFYIPFYPTIVNAMVNGHFISEMIAATKDKIVGYDNEVMPVSVYDGYEDYNPFAAPLYREWGSKFITGDIPMSDWDKYVKEWYDKGGQVVTDRATKWYKEFWGID